MRNGKQPLMYKRVKNTRYDTARSGSTEGGISACKTRDTILHAVGALREVLVGNYEERRAVANASYLRALSMHVKITRYDTAHSESTEGGNYEEQRVTANTRYNIAHSGSTEGGNYEELRVTANVWTREKHAIRWCTHCGHRVGFWRKLLRNSKCKRMEIHDRMVHAVVAPSPDTLNHAECSAKPSGGIRGGPNKYLN
ncbi:hypothetical protein B0H11DRAFT_1920281 [Mycena galericulata]|nr:hypothetical protein B0H11DRAFT_1920281 [Mycena galericulata]